MSSVPAFSEPHGLSRFERFPSFVDLRIGLMSGFRLTQFNRPVQSGFQNNVLHPSTPLHLTAHWVIGQPSSLLSRPMVAQWIRPWARFYAHKHRWVSPLAKRISPTHCTTPFITPSTIHNSSLLPPPSSLHTLTIEKNTRTCRHEAWVREVNI